MPIPGHSVLPVSSSDSNILGDLLLTCKLALPINRLLLKDWPNYAAQKPLYTNTVEHNLRTVSAERWKMVNDDSGEIVGYVVLSRKRPASTEDLAKPESHNAEQNIPGFFNPDVYTAVVCAVSAFNKEKEGFDHYELTYICVKPTHRRCGIGSQLMQVCLDKAKAEGIPLALTSEPAAHDFFLGLGCTDTSHVDIDLREWAPANSGFGIFRLTGMIWTPGETAHP